MLRRFNVAPRLWFILGILITGLVIMTALAVSNLKRTQLNEKQIKSRQRVERVHSLSQHFFELSKSGQLSEVEAKNAVKALHYDGNDDFWIGGTYIDDAEQLRAIVKQFRV